MSDWRRHAIYFAPAPGSPLAAFAAAWLGWDPASGEVPKGPAGLPRPRGEIVAAPRRYGFHATLKPPFRLAAGRDVGALDDATAALAARHRAFAAALRLGALGPFLALIPAAPPEALGRLAAACVTGLDDFRAAPSAEELARRRAAGLDEREEAHLVAWGYPYVLDRFTFHMTLTGPLDPADLAAVGGVLGPALAPLLAAPVAIDAICRFSEGSDGRFRLVRRFPLAAGRAGRARPGAPAGR